MLDKTYNKDGLITSIDRFAQARILVVGDIILDEYIWGKVSRISPEAPVPVVEVHRETRMLGGAANVASNLARLGATTVLCGVIGADQAGKEILKMIKDLGLATEAVISDRLRPTSIKTRVIAHNQQVVRFDKESREPLGNENLGRILQYVSGVLAETDVILISDYGKGVVSRGLMEGIMRLARDRNIPIAVDPKTGNFPCYVGADIITPNHEEAGSYCRFVIEDDKSLMQAGQMLLADLSCAAVLITQGKDGMTLFEKAGKVTHIPAVAKEVYDVTGAGDTVIATLCLGMAAGLDLASSALLANFAGGIVVGKVGTSTVSPDELKAAITEYV